MDNSSALELYIKKFSDYDPVLSAHIIETMDVDESLDVFENLPRDVSKTIFENLQNEYAAELLGKIDPDKAGEILREMEPLKISLILGVCPMALKDKISHSLTEKQRSELREILEYPKDSVGYMMSTNFLALNQDLRLSDAVSKIRLFALKDNTPLSYVYVVDSHSRLTGVLTMRDLLIKDPDRHLRQIMIKDVFCLNAFMEVEEAARIVARRNYFAVPVVDNTGVLVGLVNTSQLLSDAHEEYSADLQTLFGAGSEERPFSGTLYSLKKRLPWLNINLATAFLAAGVIAMFEGVIAKLTVLAVFLPIVAGQGGNAGAQSLAVVMRGLVMREIPRQDFPKLFWKEGKLGLLNGILIGLVTGAVAWIWQGSPTLGIVIGLAMIVNLVVAGLAGSMIPVGLKTLGFDPAQSSMIILTTVTDIVGFFAFLGLAALFFGL